MNQQSANGRSTQAVEIGEPKLLAVQSMPPKPSYELIDANELARRLSLPVSWIRSHTRRRTLDEIPSIRFGRYCRFRWLSPELEAWIAAHEERTRG